jgi:prepilin-type N-terminal cleavage/methylation domain-containing protein
MKLRARIKRSTGGYTLLELMISIAIISILLAIVVASYETFKARIRFSQVRADLDGIVQAAYSDYTSSKDNTWALNVALGAAPSFVGTELRKWPQAPCPGWFYSWENYSAVPAINAVRVTIHRTDATALWSFCMENYGGDCVADDGSGTPTDIASLPSGSKYIYCSE